MSEIEIHVIAPDGVPIPLLAAIGKAMDKACPGATVGACECRPGCKCSIVGTVGKVTVLRSATEAEQINAAIGFPGLSHIYTLLEKYDVTERG